MTLQQALGHIIALYGEKILDEPDSCRNELGRAGFDDSSLEARLLFVLLDKNAVSEIRRMIQQNQGVTKYSLAIKAYAKMFADDAVSNECQTIFLEHIQMLIDLFGDEGIVEAVYSNHKDIMPVGNFESALEKLISDYGVSVLAAPARARAILNDLSGNMLKEESLKFEELLRKLNDGNTLFQGADDKRFLEALGQVLKNHNMKYEPLERYDAWKQEEARREEERLVEEKKIESQKLAEEERRLAERRKEIDKRYMEVQEKQKKEQAEKQEEEQKRLEAVEKFLRRKKGLPYVSKTIKTAVQILWPVLLILGFIFLYFLALVLGKLEF